MHPSEPATDPFEAARPRLRAVAFRILGSFAEADDAVQEAWIRMHRADTSEIENMDAWLTTVVSRVCLDVLRSRKLKGEDLYGVEIPASSESTELGLGPEDEALLADSLGLALLVVLKVLTPAERLAFVLHDMFKVPFADIGTIMDRSPHAAKMLASRARHRVRRVDVPDEPPLDRQREVVTAFLTAARGGNLAGLVKVLDPDVTLRVDISAVTPVRTVQGAEQVAEQALMFQALAPQGRLAFINGRLGLVTIIDGRVFNTITFTTRQGRVTKIDVTLVRRQLDSAELLFLPPR